MEPGGGHWGKRSRAIVAATSFTRGPTQFVCGTAVQRSWRGGRLTIAKVSAIFASHANADTAAPERLGSG
jgi:hypothetical protein